MDVLWERGPSTVLEIQERLTEDLVDSTIRTLLRILEEKGYVERQREGRAYRYAARVGREEARAGVMDLMLRRFFRTPADLIANLIDAGELSAGELEEIRALVEQRREREES